MILFTLVKGGDRGAHKDEKKGRFAIVEYHFVPGLARPDHPDQGRRPGYLVFLLSGADRPGVSPSVRESDGPRAEGQGGEILHIRSLDIVELHRRGQICIIVPFCILLVIFIPLCTFS